MRGRPSTGRKWIRGPATSVSRDESTSSAAVPSRSQPSCRTNSPPSSGWPATMTASAFTDAAAVGDAVATGDDGNPTLAHGELAAGGVVDRRADDAVRRAGVRRDLRDDVLDIVPASDHDRPGEVVTEGTLAQQPLAPEPPLEHECGESDGKCEGEVLLREVDPEQEEEDGEHSERERARGGDALVLARADSEDPGVARVGHGEREQPGPGDHRGHGGGVQRRGVRAAAVHGMPAARAASTTPATMTVSDTWRRTRYLQAHRAPESLESPCADSLATADGVTRSPREVAAGRCRLGISVMAGSARSTAVRGRAAGCSGRVGIGLWGLFGARRRARRRLAQFTPPLSGCGCSIFRVARVDFDDTGGTSGNSITQGLVSRSPHRLAESLPHLN